MWTRYVCLIPDHRDGGAVCGLGMSVLYQITEMGVSVWTRYVCLIPDHRDGGQCGLGMSV